MTTARSKLSLGEQERVFDEYAQGYRDAVNSSIGASGESVDFFADLKASLVASRLRTSSPVVLDFGCGTGLSTRALAGRLGCDSSIVGVDPSSTSIEMARQHAHPANVRYDQLPASGLPFEEGRFDVVFAACVFHHIEEAERMRWMRELARVLKKGGLLFIFEHNPLNPLTRRAVRSCPFDDGVVLLGPSYACACVRGAGLDAETPHFYFFLPNFLAPLRRFENMLRRVPLGAQYFVVGRKDA